MAAIKDQSGGVAPAGPAAKVRGILPSEDFTFSLTPNNTQISGSSSGQTTIADSVYDTSTAATVDQTQSIRVSVPFASPFPYMTPTFINNTPGVATVDASGNTTRTGDGTASIDITVPGRTRKRAQFSVLRAGGQTSNVFSAFASGSLGKALADDIAARISGKTASDAAKNIFSSMDHVSRVYPRNPACWAAGADLTCIPAASEYSLPTWFTGTLVTPRHLLVCDHEHLFNGLKIFFVKQDSTVVTRTIVGNYSIPQGTGHTNGSDAWDLHLYALDSDVPSGITFAKVLPATFRHALFTPANGFPAVVGNQFKQLSIADANSFLSNGLFSWLQVTQSADAGRGPWFTPTIAGDSGSAMGYIINGALVLQSQINGAGPNGTDGPNDSDCITEINAGIAALDTALSAVTGYQLTTLDVSGYTSY